MLTPLCLRPAVLVLLFVSSAAFAEKIEPPSELLGKPTTTIVVADFKEAGPANRIVFSTVTVLQNQQEVPALIDIGKPDLREPLVAGKRYILAYSPFAEDRYERIVVSPRGANFLSSPGIEPGLWDDSAENQALVMWRIGDEESELERGDEDARKSRHDTDAAKAAMPRLLKMLSSGESQHREFAAAEIAYRPALLAELDASEQKALQRFVESDIGPDRSRAALLAAAASMPVGSKPVRGWDTVVTRLLGKLPVETLVADRRSSLVLAALAYPPTRQRHADGALQARWLRSDDMGVVEAAAQALQDMSVDLAKSRIDAAIADRTLPSDNRSVLEGYQQRLALMKKVGVNNKAR